MKEKKTNKLLLLWYSHPRIAVAMMLVGVNLLVILLFTIVLSLISQNSFFDELSYLFTYTMCSDGIYDFVNNQEDVACFIVKIILTIIQMVIFSGALIGFTTDILQNAFDKRLNNKDAMQLKNHYVFLNWSTIGQNIIYDLSFLEGEKTIVILTEEEREDVLTSIDNIFTAMNRSKQGLRIFVKKGSPTSSKHLSDISISSAKHIGILLSGKEAESNENISVKDLDSFKLLLSIIGRAPNANVVVETESEETKEKIEQLISVSHPSLKRHIAVFSHGAVMGHILGRTVINPSFARLFHHVLSFDGVEFYSIPEMDVGEALRTYNDCIPIINYDDGEVDHNGETNSRRLYVLNDNEASLGLRKVKKDFVKPLNYAENLSFEDFTLFIFSDSDRAQFVLRELENQKKTSGANIQYYLYSYSDDLQALIPKIERTKGKRKILLLSEEESDPNKQDSAVFLSLLELKQSEIIDNDVELFVEVVNIDNVIPVRNIGINSVILSNKIISLYMLQLLTHSGSREFFKDALLSNSDEGKFDFEITAAKDVLIFEKGALIFSSYSELVQSFYHASQKRRMLIGLLRANGQEKELCFFCDRMDENRNLVIYPSDELITVRYA